VKTEIAREFGLLRSGVRVVSPAISERDQGEDNPLPLGDLLPDHMLVVSCSGFVRVYKNPHPREQLIDVNVFPVRDRLWDVKQRLETITSIPAAEQRLLFETRELEDDFCLVTLAGANRTPSDSQLRLVRRAPESFPIRIETVDGRHLSLAVREADLISEIKERIQGDTTVPAAHQELFFGARRLANECVVGDYQIQAKATLHLRLRGDNSSSIPLLDIVVHDHEKGTMTDVRVRPTDAIRTAGPAGLWADRGTHRDADFWLAGVKLNPDKTFEHYSIRSGMTLHLVTEWHGIVSVKTLTGKNIGLMASSTSTIDDLKESLAEKVGIQPWEARLVFAGRQLEEGVTLEEYGIHGDCTIHCCLRLRG
jgi:hypothetical protein